MLLHRVTELMAHWFGVRLNESTVRVHSVHYTHPWKTAKKKKLITKTRIAEKLRKKKKIIFNSLKYGVLIGGNGVSVIIFFPNRANFANDNNAFVYKTGNFLHFIAVINNSMSS